MDNFHRFLEVTLFALLAGNFFSPTNRELFTGFNQNQDHQYSKLMFYTGVESMLSLYISLLLSFSAAAEDKVSVEFENTIETCISQEVLWDQLVISMDNSLESWLWPTRLSEVEGQGMLENSQIDVTYKSFFFTRTYSYSLSEIEDGTGFRYTAIEGQHPFEGGAHVWLETQEDGLVLFHWKGEYLTDPGDWMERAFFESYSEDFFESFADIIDSKESKYCLENS